MELSIKFNKIKEEKEEDAEEHESPGNEIYNCLVGTDAAIQDNTEKILEDGSKYGKRALIAQCILTSVVAITSAGAGMPIGYSAVLLPQLKTTNGSLQTDDDMGSWIASIHSAATPIGSLLSGTLMELLGRKLTIQISIIPFVAGWICIALSQNHAVLITGRVFAGIAVGLTFATAQVYIAETCDPARRGVFSSIPFTSYTFGILLVYMLGSIAYWRAVAGFCVILSTIAAILYFFLPDSPVSLIKKGKMEAARKACAWLRGGDIVLVKQNIQQIVCKIDNERNQENKKHSFWSIFRSSQVLKPFIIINIYITLQLYSGVYILVFYAIDIISHMEGSENVNEFFVGVLTAGIRFIFTVISSILWAFVGLRTIGLTSAIGTAISALAVAACLYIPSLNNINAVTTCLLFYVAANTIGLMPLPSIMIGEMFPARVRGLAGGLTYTLYYLQSFIATKIFPILKHWLGIPGLFLLFGVSATMASLFTYLVLPETRGKSLGDIEDYFRQGNIMWITRNKNDKNHDKK